MAEDLVEPVITTAGAQRIEEVDRIAAGAHPSARHDVVATCGWGGLFGGRSLFGRRLCGLCRWRGAALCRRWRGTGDKHQAQDHEQRG